MAYKRTVIDEYFTALVDIASAIGDLNLQSPELTGEQLLALMDSNFISQLTAAYPQLVTAGYNDTIVDVPGTAIEVNPPVMVDRDFALKKSGKTVFFNARVSLTANIAKQLYTLPLGARPISLIQSFGRAETDGIIRPILAAVTTSGGVYVNNLDYSEISDTPDLEIYGLWLSE